MPNHCFISYSHNDGTDHALRLYQALREGSPSFPVWLDIPEMRPVYDWDVLVGEAIKTCGSLLFLMTRDSTHPISACKKEWSYALSCKKPVIPINFAVARSDIPFRLHNRHYVDFTGSFDAGLQELRSHLVWIGSPEGRLRQLQYRIQDARRDLEYTAVPAAQERIREDISVLEEEIRLEQLLIAAPEEVARQAEERIRRSLECERRFRDLQPGAKVRVINEPPGAAPSYFQDRCVETGIIGRFLRDDALRIMTIAGRAGAGKTVLACRVLKSLEQLHLPDDLGPIEVDGIVYEVCGDSPGTMLQSLFSDLSKLLSDEIREQWDQYFVRSNAPVSEKARLLLKCFPRGRVVVLLDNLERAIDVESQCIKDDDLASTLRVVVDESQHAVRILITTRVEPVALRLPGRSALLRLDEGLPFPDAERLLREMDADGRIGLRDARVELLAEAHRRTLGLPRALEALFMILASDRSTSLSDVLERAQGFLPDQVVEKLVGEAFSRLDVLAQQVMQVLALFGCPVPPVAVDYVLGHYRSGIDSAAALRRLVNMGFARSERGRYYLHEADRVYALARLSEQGEGFCKAGLHRLAAGYYKELRKDLKECKEIDELEPYLKEFDHLVTARDFDEACRVFNLIDRGHLSRWGHSPLVIEKRQQLLDKIATRYLEGLNLGHLGSAYREAGDISKGLQYYQQALEIARDLRCREETRWVGNIGVAWADLGQIWKEKKCLERALDLARGISDRLHEGRWLCNRGGVFSRTQVEKAIECLQQALRITRQTDDDRFEELCLYRLGDIFDKLGETQQAARWYLEALPITRRKGDKREEIRCLGALGDCKGQTGDLRAEVAYYSQALEVDRRIVIDRSQGDRRGRACLLIRVLAAMMELGDHRSALAMGRDAVPLLHELGMREDEIAVSIRLARIAETAGDLGHAASVYRQLAASAGERGDRGDEVGLLACLAATQVNAGQNQEEPEKTLRRALELAGNLRGRSDEGRWPEVITTASRQTANQSAIPRAAGCAHQRFESAWFLTLGRAFALSQRFRRGRECFEKAVSAACQVGDAQREMRALTAIGDCCGQLRKTADQAPHYERALLIAGETKNRTEEANISATLAAAYVSQGKLREAISQFQRAADILVETGRREDELRVRSALGELYIELGEGGPATDHYSRGLEIAQELDNREQQVQLLRDLGAACYFLEEPLRAVDYYERGLPIARQTPESDQEAVAIFNIGDAYHLAGKVDRAIPYYCQALTMGKPTTNFKAAAGLAVAYLQQGCVDEARQYFERCAAFCESLVEREPGFYPEHCTFALAQLGLGRSQEALLAYREGLRECCERQALEGRVSTGPIRYALLDLYVFKRVPQPVPGLDEAIQILKGALREWERLLTAR